MKLKTDGIIALTFILFLVFIFINFISLKKEEINYTEDAVIIRCEKNNIGVLCVLKTRSDRTILVQNEMAMIIYYSVKAENKYNTPFQLNYNCKVYTSRITNKKNEECYIIPMEIATQ